MLAGIILGPALLEVVFSSAPLQFLADLGTFFAMFYAVMEMDPRELVKHIWPSLAVAIGGFVLPFVLGYFACRLFGGTLYQSLFVGMGLSITAIAMQAVILQNMQVHRTKEGRIIIGAAIADDILSLICLSVLLGLAESGEIQASGLLLIIFKVVLLFVFIILAGHFVIPVLTRRLKDLDDKGFTFALLFSALIKVGGSRNGPAASVGRRLSGRSVCPQRDNGRKDLLCNQ